MNIVHRRPQDLIDYGNIANHPFVRQSCGSGLKLAGSGPNLIDLFPNIIDDSRRRGKLFNIVLLYLTMFN